MSQRPPVVINLIAPQPPVGKQWCATCAMLWLGDISTQPETQALARSLTEKAEKDDIGEVDIPLFPEKTWRKLNLAITTAPSVYFQVPMPVCWVHIQGYDPEKGTQGTAARLLNGRKGQRT